MVMYWECYVNVMKELWGCNENFMEILWKCNGNIMGKVVNGNVMRVY